MIISRRFLFAAVTAAVVAAAGPVHAATAAVLELYKAKCQVCHMADGKSAIAAMDFADGKWIHGSTPAQVAKIIAEGAPGTAMLPFKAVLTPKEIADLAAYVRTFDKSLAAKPKPKAKPTK